MPFDGTVAHLRALVDNVFIRPSPRWDPRTPERATDIPRSVTILAIAAALILTAAATIGFALAIGA